MITQSQRLKETKTNYYANYVLATV